MPVATIFVYSERDEGCVPLGRRSDRPNIGNNPNGETDWAAIRRAEHHPALLPCNVRGDSDWTEMGAVYVSDPGRCGSNRTG